MRVVWGLFDLILPFLVFILSFLWSTSNKTCRKHMLWSNRVEYVSFVAKKYRLEYCSQCGNSKSYKIGRKAEQLFLQTHTECPCLSICWDSLSAAFSTCFRDRVGVLVVLHLIFWVKIKLTCWPYYWRLTTIHAESSLCDILSM